MSQHRTLMYISQRSDEPANKLQHIADSFFDILALDFPDDESALLRDIAVRTQQRFGQGEASIFLVTGPPHESVITYKAGSSAVTSRRLRGLQLKRGEGVVGWVIEQGQACLIPDAQNATSPAEGPIFSPTADAQSNYQTRSLACVPIIIRQQIIGALELVGQRPNQFSETDLNLLKSAAYFSAILIQQFRHLQATRRRAQLLDARAKVISQTVPSFDNLDHLLEKMVDSIRINFEFYYVGLYLVDETEEPDNQGWVRLKVASGKHNDRVQAMLAEGRRLKIDNNSMIGWTTQHGKPRISLHVGEKDIVIRHIDPARLDPPRPMNQVVAKSRFLPETQSSIALPLMAYGVMIGAITIQSEARDYFSEENFSNEDVGTLQALVDQLAFVVYNAKLHHSLERRTKHSEATAQVGANIISILNVERLLEQTVELIHEKFDLYYAGIFLIETVEEQGQSWQVAKLKAASGQEGRKLLAKGHQLEVGSNSMVGYTTSSGQARIALDVDEETIRFQHPDLPEARSEMSLPLRNRAGIIGALDVQSKQKDAFTPEDIQTLQIMADHLATAIYNAQLYQRTEEDRQHLAALRDIEQAIINTELGLEEILALIVEKGLALTKAKQGSVSLLENDKTHLRVVMSNKVGEIGLRLPVENSIPGLVVKQRQTIRIPEVALDRRYRLFYNLYGPRTASVLLIPLQENDIITGVFSIATQFSSFNQYTPLSDRQQATLETLAEHAALAIKNAKLFESEQKRTKHNEFLRRVAQHVSSTLHLDEIMETILVELREVVDYDGASIQLMRGDALEIVKYRGWLEPAQVIGLRFPRDSATPNAKIIETRQSLLLNDTHETQSIFDKLLTDGIRSWLGVPLLFKGKLLGIITVDSQKANHFSPEQVELTEAFASQVASALENANLFEQQRETAQKLLEAETIRSMAEATGQSLHWVTNQTAPILYWTKKIRESITPILDGEIVDEKARQDFSVGINIIEENSRRILKAKEGIMGPVRPFELVEVEIAQVIHSVIKNLDLEASGVEVGQHLPPALPPVQVDRLALEEVFRNLIINAYQAIQTVESPYLRLSGQLVKEGRFVQIKVSDNGPGIPSQKLKDIWTPFYTTKAGAGGTGVGLSYCLQAIHKMGGKISVESEVGRGTTFTLEIPVYQ